MILCGLRCLTSRLASLLDDRLDGFSHSFHCILGLTPKTDLMSHRATNFRIGWSNHRVIRLKVVALSILGFRQTICGEVSTYRLVGLAVDE